MIVAAGAGTRLGGETPKALRVLAGRPILAYSIESLRASGAIEGIVVVGPEPVREAAVASGCDAAEGGETRQRSVYAGLQAAPSSSEFVLVHDAARPLASSRLIARVAAALGTHDAVVPCIPVADTLKRSAGGEAVEETVSREGLWRAQTPQGFRLSLLLDAHDRARSFRFDATDDAALVERFGVKPAIVAGDELNIKITIPADLELAEAILAARR